MSLIELRKVAHVISGQHILETDHNQLGQGIGYLTGPADFGLIQPAISRWTENPKVTCEPGDILITVKGAGVGKVNLAPDTTVAIGRQLMAIRGIQNYIDTNYLFMFLQTRLAYFREKAVGATVPGLSREDLESLEIPYPLIENQRRTAVRIRAQLAEVERARSVVETQLKESAKLADSIIFDSITRSSSSKFALGSVLVEVKKGIGAKWAEYPVFGATRDGLALAKEPPGKHPHKYKPVAPGTVFYNPMRILIGSIAFVDQDDTPGITSPDYVVLEGKEGVVDSRWFYFWLRSPLGEQCINSLARGAVRERMLFNRLAEGEIELPGYTIQQRASAALKEIQPMRRSIEQRLNEILTLPQKILAQAFEN